MLKLIKVLGFSALLWIIGCTPTNTNSLITDAFSVGDCPELSCAQGIADPADTKVILTSPLTVAMPQGGSLAEISGECYPSLYPQNQFQVVVATQGGVVLPNSAILPTGFVARCDAGKFYVPISLQGRAAGTYSVTLTFQVIDSLGQVITPPFKTVSASYLFSP